MNHEAILVTALFLFLAIVVGIWDTIYGSGKQEADQKKMGDENSEQSQTAVVNK